MLRYTPAQAAYEHPPPFRLDLFPFLTPPALFFPHRGALAFCCFWAPRRLSLSARAWCVDIGLEGGVRWRWCGSWCTPLGNRQEVERLAQGKSEVKAQKAAALGPGKSHVMQAGHQQSPGPIPWTRRAFAVVKWAPWWRPALGSLRQPPHPALPERLESRVKTIDQSERATGPKSCKRETERLSGTN